MGDLELTTSPDSFLSGTTAFNALAWGLAGGFAGSFVKIPTPEGDVNFGGIGALAGVGAYLAIAAKNSIIGGLKDIEEAIDPKTVEIPPNTKYPDRIADPFQKKYGVTINEALATFKTHYPLTQKPNYLDASDQNFYDWADQYYLHKDAFSEDDVKNEFRKVAGDKWEDAWNIAKYYYFGFYNHQKDDPLGINVNRWIMKNWIPKQFKTRPNAIRSRSDESAPLEEEEEVDTLLYTLAGAGIGYLTDRPLLGALGGFVFSELSKKRKLVDQSPALSINTPALTIKRRKLSYDDLARLHGQIVALRQRLTETTNPTERETLQKRIDELVDIYANSPSD